MLKSVRPPASGLLLWNSPRARRRKTKRNFSTSWTTRGEKLEQFPRTCYRRTTTYIRRVKRLPKPSKSNFDSKHSKQRNGINTSFIDKKLPTRLLERLSGIQPERTSCLGGVPIPPLIASAPSGGGSSKSAKAELYSLFMGSYELPIGEVGGCMLTFC